MRRVLARERLHVILELFAVESLHFWPIVELSTQASLALRRGFQHLRPGTESRDPAGRSRLLSLLLAPGHTEGRRVSPLHIPCHSVLYAVSLVAARIHPGGEGRTRWRLDGSLEQTRARLHGRRLHNVSTAAQQPCSPVTPVLREAWRGGRSQPALPSANAFCVSSTRAGIYRAGPRTRNPDQNPAQPKNTSTLPGVERLCAASVAACSSSPPPAHGIKF